MESFPTADESAIINDTPEQLDTWNQPRSNEALRSFVTSRMVTVGEITDDDLFGLAA